MNKESKLNLNAGDYAISHCDSDKAYNCLEVHKMLCDAYIAGNNDTLEDDDERIKNSLINLIKMSNEVGGLALHKWEADEMLAWLEKQGEHANFRNKIKVGDKVTRNEDGVLVNLSQLRRVAKPSEKQGEQKASYTTIVETGDGGINALVTRELPTDGEQKPADIVEPKFKVGEKIRIKTPSSFDKDMQVARIEKDYYVCNHIGKFSSEVVPFSKQSSYELVEPKQGWRAEDEAVLDALIRRLKGEDIHVSPHLAVECLESLKDRVLSQPKQEWSEEDEQHIDSLLKRLDALCRNKFERTRFAISEDRDWLKSLRPQNKCAYNPYKAVVESIAEMCKHYDKASHSGLRDFYDNVKVKCKDAQEYDKMFPQNHWKPSDKQMDALWFYAKQNNYAGAVLTSLYNDLKKLKEE